MPIRTHLLVVANQTVDSPDLLDALAERGQHGPVHVKLVAPVLLSAREEARARLRGARGGGGPGGGGARAGGGGGGGGGRPRLILPPGFLGDADPIVAV